MTLNRTFFTNIVLFGVASAVWAQTADLSHLVVVGDSLSAGVQNISLLDTQQVNGYAYLIAKQAGVPMVLPLIKYPGLPNVLRIGFNPLPVLQAVPGAPPSPARDNPSAQPTNLAVPGTTVGGALVAAGTLPPPVNSWEEAVLQSTALPDPSAVSQVQAAIALHPSTVILWLGGNDALLPALTGGAIKFTDINTFAIYFGAAFGLLAQTGATMIVANIPDVTEVPFFTPVTRVAELAGKSPDSVAAKLGIGAGDYLRLSALQPALNILLGLSKGPLPHTCPVPYPGFPPVPNIPCVMTAADAADVRAHVDGYNAAIAAIVAGPKKTTVVDIHSLFEQISADGYKVPGNNLNTSYLGGLFSLDGIHPTNTAYAIIAQRFIDTMNANLHTSIPAININKIAKSDPLVF